MGENLTVSILAGLGVFYLLVMLLNVGFTASLPWRTFASTNVYYGSGFVNGSYTPGVPPGAPGGGRRHRGSRGR